MAIVGLARVDGTLVTDRARQLVAGYTKAHSLTLDELAALPGATEHAALIIAFHRYYRHNVRFPDPAQAHIHKEMIKFVQSLGGFTVTS